MIDNLPMLAPDPSRNANTVVRCHHRLAARRRKIEGRTRAPRRVLAEHLLVAGVGVAYLIAMAGHLLAVAGRR